jgi:hypothetical protein|tara:strand:+ start:579 stop:1316 length:738 start_codon:yes stop_codon:yes gene_type:complete
MAGALNPNMVQPAGVPNNPYQQASQAQAGSLGAMMPAMGRVGAGMTETAASGMANYQNPYEDQVVQASMRDIGNQGLKMQNTLGAQATAAGSFGGSRHGVAEAELAKSTQQQMLDQAAKLRQQGFNTALGASQADLNRQLGAANQLSGMAGQLSGLGQTSFNMGNNISDRQMAQGGMQQALMQQLINAAKGQYGDYADAPMNKLQLPLAALGVAPKPESNTTTKELGIYDYLTAGASALYGMPRF